MCNYTVSSMLSVITVKYRRYYNITNRYISLKIVFFKTVGFAPELTCWIKSPDRRSYHCSESEEDPPGDANVRAGCRGIYGDLAPNPESFAVQFSDRIRYVWSCAQAPLSPGQCGLLSQPCYLRRQLE